MSTYNFIALSNNFLGESTYDTNLTQGEYMVVPAPPFLIPSSPSWYLLTLYSTEPQLQDKYTFAVSMVMSVQSGILKFVYGVFSGQFNGLAQVDTNGNLFNIKPAGTGFSIPNGPFAVIMNNNPPSRPYVGPRGYTVSYTQIL